MRTETLPERTRWLRLADPRWADPLDATHGAARGGRWMAPGGPATLYLNETVAVARANVRRFLAPTPVEPEDLDDDGGFVLVEVSLPRNQEVLDAHTVEGLRAVRLPASYPLDGRGAEVSHARCQRVGRKAFDADLDGVRCRSAAGGSTDDLRELAWFTRGRRARTLSTHRFGDWYFGRT